MRLIIATFLFISAFCLKVEIYGQNKVNPVDDFYLIDFFLSGEWSGYAYPAIPNLIGGFKIHPTEKVLQPIRSGSSLFLGEDFPLFIHEYTDARNLEIRFDENIVYVNNKIRTLILDKSSKSITWLKFFKPSDISELDCVIIDSDFPLNSMVEYIYKIIEIRPSVFMKFEDPILPVMAIKIRSNSPKILYLEELNEYVKNIDVSKVEYLICSDELKKFNADKFKEITARMQNLKQLACNGNQIPFFLKNRQINSLAVSNTYDRSQINLNFLVNFPELRSLGLFGIAGKLDCSGLHHLTKLNSLCIGGDTLLQMINVSNNIKGLKSFSIFDDKPTLFKSDNLMEIVENNPELVHLQIHTDPMPSLASIAKLKKLELLDILNTNTNLQYLAQLPKLKQVGVGVLKFGEDKEDKEKDNKIILEVKRYCPKCLVIDSSPCLGSGWLLFSIFAIVILLYAFKSMGLKKT